MLQRCLSRLLITLVALQSVIAIADSHQIHQSGKEHFAHEYEQAHGFDQPIVKADSVAPETLPDTADTSQLDCQHCCHCHGTGQVILAMEQVNTFNNQISKITSLCRFAYLSYSFSPDNPPPIS